WPMQAPYLPGRPERPFATMPVRSRDLFKSLEGQDARAIDCAAWGQATGSSRSMAFPRIASAREDAYLQSERLWVIVLAKLDADAVLAGVVEGAVVLAAAESNR